MRAFVHSALALALGSGATARPRRPAGTAATTCRSTRSPAGGEGPRRRGACQAYDGGQPTDAPDLAGKPITLVDVPKLIGIGYFNATTKGMQDAAKELGNVKVTTTARPRPTSTSRSPSSTTTSPAASTASCSPPTIPVAIAPVLKKALGKGIHVVGYDANSQPDAREWFVNQASSTASPRR